MCLLSIRIVLLTATICLLLPKTKFLLKSVYNLHLKINYIEIYTCGFNIIICVYLNMHLQLLYSGDSNNQKFKMTPRMCVHLPYFLKSCPSSMLLTSTFFQGLVWIQKDMTGAQMIPNSTPPRSHSQWAPAERQEGNMVSDKIRPS